MFSPGFPPNYNPFKQYPVDDPPPIPDAIKQKAKVQGAEYIHKSGGYSIKWLFDKMYRSNAPDFDSWWPVDGELPTGELSEL